MWVEIFPKFLSLRSWKYSIFSSQSYYSWLWFLELQPNCWEKKQKKRKTCVNRLASGFIATAFSYLTTRRIYFHECHSNELHVLFVPGGRFAFRKNVLLITDGRSNVDTHLTIPNAEKLKGLGVHIYVFAVGSYISGIGEMVQVAGSRFSTKPDDYLFRIKGYHQLWEFTKLVVTKLASTGKYISLSPQPSPC